MTDTDRPMTDGPLVHKLRAEDATSVTLVSVPPFGSNVFPEVWHVPTRVVNAILAQPPAPAEGLRVPRAVLIVAREHMANPHECHSHECIDMIDSYIEGADR